MKISELINKLEKIKKQEGDLRVWLEISFFDGPWGEYNAEMRGPTYDMEDLRVKKEPRDGNDKVVIIDGYN